MTYLERITYLTGNFIQVCQFTVKNAFRVIALTEGKEKQTYYMQNSYEYIQTLEATSKEYLKSSESLSGEKLSEFFTSHHGLSSKDLKDLTSLLTFRDKLIASFYLDNSYAISKEDVTVYEGLIADLTKKIEKLEKLNVSFSKACDRLYDSF